MTNMNGLDQHWSRSSFDRAAQRYDEAAVLQRHVGDELLDRCATIKTDGALVLDLGCGTGYLSRKLKLQAPKMITFGVDCSFSMSRHCLQHSFSSICADAQRLPFEKESFDLIISNLAIQWCDYNRVFHEVARLLKPGGRWMFSSVGQDTLMELRAAWAAVDNHQHVHEFADMHHLGDSMLLNGLKDPVLDVDRINMTYENVMTLLTDLRTLGVVNASTARHRGLTGRTKLKAMLNAYEDFRDVDGLLPSTWEIIYGQADKAHDNQVKVHFSPGRG